MEIRITDAVRKLWNRKSVGAANGRPYLFHRFYLSGRAMRAPTEHFCHKILQHPDYGYIQKDGRVTFEE
jgi:hypothetical protein